MTRTRWFRSTIFLVLGATACWAQRGGFQGPAVMSRPGGPLGRTSGAPLAFRPFLGISARYDGNLFPIDAGPLSGFRQNRFGLQAQWGLYGVRRGERNLVGLSYAGTYRHYTQGGRFSGANQFLSLNYMHQVSQRTVVFVAPGFGIYKYGLNATATPLIADPTMLSELHDPGSEVFDNRTYSFNAGAGLSHQLSERWSMLLGGGGFYIKRMSNALISSQGSLATSSLSYQLGPRQRIGFSYHYSFYFFPRGYGETQNHTLFLDYGAQLTERWNFSVAVGGLRSESDRLTRVNLDPDLAALTGQKTVLEATHRLVYRPALRLTLGRQLERGSLSFYYRRDVSPGNGFISSAVRDFAGASYSYTATEKLNIGFSVTANRFESLTQQIGRHTTVGGGVGFNYMLGKYFHLTGRVDVRRWRVNNSNFDRDRLGASLGLTFSPGETPLALW